MSEKVKKGISFRPVGKYFNIETFEREMEVENQESRDKSRRGLKGGSVGVNGPCP